ncbi:MAG: hypothetical protein ABR976_09220 [Terracidiphilus sp.]|jgi:hypothetical protein
MGSQGVLIDVSCAVEVFIATALLHWEQPGRPDFTIQEIVNRAAIENISGEMRSGVNVHASQHCVANRPPNPAKHRMLFATGKHTRRLLLRGDGVHGERTGKIFPNPSEVPERYLPLLEWAKTRFEKGEALADPLPRGGFPNVDSHPGDELPEPPRRHLQALLDMRLAGVHLSNGEDPDDYVRRLREGWD